MISLERLMGNRGIRRMAVALPLISLLAACSKEPAPPVPEEKLQIAFSSQGVFNESYPHRCSIIDLIDEDGNNRVALTDSTAYDTFPVFSTDAKSLAFMESKRSDPSLIRLKMKELDSGLERTIDETNGGMNRIVPPPSFSRDGSKIAYALQEYVIDSAGVPRPYSWIRVYDLNASQFQDITGKERAEYVSPPCFSPVDDKIAFVSNRPGEGEGEIKWFGGEVFLMNHDGSGKKRLTYDQTRDYKPVFSPDGQSIAYYIILGYPDFLDPNLKSGKLVVMSKEGSQRRVISGEYDARDMFSWSPDSRKIVFTTTPRSDYDHLSPCHMVLCDLQSGSLERISDSYLQGNYSYPQFCPDDKVVFIFNNCGYSCSVTYDLLVMDLKSKEVKNLTNDKWDSKFTTIRTVQK